MSAAGFSVFALAAGAVLLSWLYFRRFAISRPPIGVISLGDVVVVLVGVVVVPYLYLALPVWLVLGALALGMAGVLELVTEGILHRARQRWILVVALATANAGIGLVGPGSAVGLISNDLLLVAVVVGVANLWAQSGLRARDAVVLATGLAAYDLVFTAILPTTNELFGRLGGLPFAPMIAWPIQPAGHWLALGLGDLMLAAVWPLALHKAYGRRRALVGAVVELGVLAVVLIGPHAGTFPVMIVLGPLMVAQYALWRWRAGPERPFREYLLAIE